MDYATAAEIINSNRNRRKNPNMKKLGHKLWLERVLCDRHGEEVEGYDIQLFTKPIIRLWPDGFEVNDHGYFSHTTHKRLNEYMPRGFRVWGYTPRFLKRPVGLVGTPKGVFPYKLPVEFTYEGEPIGASLCHETGEVLPRIPKYVDDLLRAVFEHEGLHLADLRRTEMYMDGHEASNDLSAAVGAMVRDNRYYAGLPHVAVIKEGDAIGNPIDGTSMLEVTAVLANHGFEPFSSAGQARLFERTIQHGRKLPVLNKTKLKSRLRKVLIEHIVNALGFEEVSWNRR